jgi:hypothetical protein
MKDKEKEKNEEEEDRGGAEHSIWLHELPEVTLKA